MPGMMGEAPKPQAISAAMSFLDVIKLAGSSDVQATLIQMQDISNETQARLAAAQQLEVQNTQALAEIAAGRNEIENARRDIAHDAADIAAAKADIQASRQLAGQALEDAHHKAEQILADAETQRSDAAAAVLDARAMQTEAAAHHEAAAVAHAEADNVKAAVQARLDRINAAVAP